MYFSVRTHSHSRIMNRRQLQIFRMPNISHVSATHRRWPQIASLIIHTVRLSLAWTSTICLRFIKICRRVKNRAKIVRCELGISLPWKPGAHFSMSESTTETSNSTRMVSAQVMLYHATKTSSCCNSFWHKHSMTNEKYRAKLNNCN